MVRVPKTRFFSTYGEAMRHYEVGSEKRARPFRVRRPPAFCDFEEHGHFRRGEIIIEGISHRTWGGSFGGRNGVIPAWNAKRQIHNHPHAITLLGGLPSQEDCQNNLKQVPEVVSSPFGIARTRFCLDAPHFQRWPKEVETTVHIRSSGGKTTTRRIKIAHGQGEKMGDMFENLASNLHASRKELTVPKSFLAQPYPMGYNDRRVVCGEVAFITWPDFRILFSQFGNDPYKLLAPDASWDRLFD